ncbi:MAG: hypothetical protein KF784_12015 [Fimbriimonadaceae bacterium]|nr:hypothetical protein [Fimbriimonadaceae bacterium]
MQSNAKGLWVIGLSAALIGGAFAQGQISGIKLDKEADGVSIHIQGSELAKPKMTSSNGGKNVKLVFDAKLLGKHGYTSVRKNGVRYVSWGWLASKPPKIHVNFVFDDPSTMKLVETEKGWAAVFGNATVEAKAAPAPKQTVAQKFPDKVPPLDMLKPAYAKDNYTPKTSEMLVATGSGESVPSVLNWQESRVSLNFVNTDVVQIIKALALQANVNIVTSPDVSGKLTVALDRVALSEALDFVTTLSGLKYAKIGRTFVVTTAAKFAETVRQISNKNELSSETRVVPIFSGQGTQIKAAVLKAVSIDTVKGQFEILLPSDQLKVSKTEDVGAAKGTGADAGQAGQAAGTGTIVEATTGTGEQKDQYVVLIGTSDRLQEVELYVRAIDRQIASAMGVDYPSSNAVVRETYFVRGGLAADLAESLGAKSNKLGNVEIAATPKTSTSRQSIVLTGREDEVKRMVASLQQLDSEDTTESSFIAYDVKYADPRALREELLAQVPGIRASIPPASAGNPKLYVAGDTKAKATEVVDPNATSTQNAPGNKQAISIKSDQGKDQGLGQPYSSLEDVAYPMRLILRGSPNQLSRAKEMLSVLDIAPRQIALELRIMELTKTDAQRLGIDWNLLTGGTLQSIRINQGTGDTSATPGNVGGSLGHHGASISALATLDQIANNRNLIARPNLFAMDGRETELFVGDVVRYIESLQTTQNGTTVVTGEVPVGIRFAVLPRIGGEGKITMDIRPVVASLTGFTPVPGGGNLPQTSVRVAQSSVAINSGETIALGGLIQETERRNVSGIPILKDLPLIGALFRRSDISKDRTEIVFFITARVVNPEDRENAANPKKGGN